MYLSNNLTSFKKKTGPTGIIGRPHGYGGYGTSGYGGNYGPLGGHVGNVPGALNTIGNGFPGAFRPSGPGFGIPYNSGNGGRPIGAQFDDDDNDLDRKKSVEKKSIKESN